MLLAFETPTCDPCRALQPTLKEIAKENAGAVLIVQIDNATEGSLASRFKLTRVPTLVCWRDGHEIARNEGAVAAATIRANLEFLLGTKTQPTTANGPSIALDGAPNVPPSSTGTQDGQPIVVTDATFESEVLKSSLPVLVDFWAPWCGPCRMVSPIVEELGRQYAGRLRVAKVNSDENPTETSRLGILGIPTLIFFAKGREVDRVVGAVPKATLVNHVTQVLKGATVNR